MIEFILGHKLLMLVITMILKWVVPRMIAPQKYCPNCFAKLDDDKSLTKIPVTDKEKKMFRVGKRCPRGGCEHETDFVRITNQNRTTV